MGKNKWDLLNFIYMSELNSFDVADEFWVTPRVARMRLLRTFKQGWLERRKFEGVYYYKVSKKAWNFYGQYASFIRHPFYG